MTYQQHERLLVSTTSYIPGYRITRYVGMAFGATVRSRGVGGDCMASCESSCGGEVTAYTEMAIEARNQAIQRLLQDANRMGANAVIEIRFDSDEIGQGGNNATIAYGTAVVVVPESR
ncbi:MAG: heavy metal-binding domain-containing protein [Candidatus Odinarchaeota archaeon]